jgi:hypothetical protein
MITKSSIICDVTLCSRQQFTNVSTLTEELIFPPQNVGIPLPHWTV